MVRRLRSGDPGSLRGGCVTALAALDLGPAEHFAVNVHAAVYRLIAHARRLAELGGGTGDDVFERHPFLRGHLEAMAPYLPAGLDWDATAVWWPHALDAGGAAAPAGPPPPPPLLALARAGVIDQPARTALLVAGLAEEDSRFG